MFARYIRVSSKDQSFSSQASVIDQWLNGRESLTYRDKATGSNFTRTGFDRLQEAIESGKIDTVVVYRLDRLGRNMVEGLQVLTDWLQKGVRIVSVTQDFDFSGAQGKLIAALLLGIAEMELEGIKSRQRAGISIAKVKRKYTGRKPGSFKGDPARALSLREKGLTHDEIAKAMGVSTKSVQRYLTSAGAGGFRRSTPERTRRET